ncbi:MAG: tetratricopeptide repeat protein [Phycisphaerae bacterium]|nr:tetratricopeptide repeat protein [Phycisphaerae bacterium]MDW8263282.1 tetratricopeptide repeat protein [Phycisphaerales bacterium]
MAARRHAISATPSRLSQLWQFPLLVISLLLFGYAAYLFIDPQPGLSADEKIDVARLLLDQDRPEAAREQLNRVLLNERLSIPQQGRLHLLLSEALAAEQKQKRLNVPANHLRIIEQVRLAMGRGVEPDGAVHRRLAESFEALGRWEDAISHYRQAASFEPARALPFTRKIIDLQILAEDRAGAAGTIEKYLSESAISDTERAWALGEKAQLLIDDGRFAQARAVLDEAMRLELDPVARGTLRYRMGYAAWKLGDTEEAERLLRVARDELQVKHPLDADACYVLGRIHQDRGDAATAQSFYQTILTSHPDARVAPLARLGRGMCRIMARQDDAALADFQQLVNEIQSRPSRGRLKGEVIEGLQLAGASLVARENFTAALEVAAFERELDPQPPAQFYARLADTYERRASQLERQLGMSPPSERIRKEQQYRESLNRAADAYVAYARMQTLADDRSHGTALWKGIELYDRAGNTQTVIATLELFVAERPDDPLAPEALLRLGRAFQAAGQFDKAIAAFQRNQFRYPQTLAASKSAVPLAQALIAKGPESYGRAEQVLIGVVDNNPLITPDSQEFRQGLLELGQLFHRMGRYEEAIARLEEFTQRYPEDERIGQLLFLTAECYRKSAAAIDPAADRGRLAQASVDELPPVDPAEAAKARNERLDRARVLYDQVIEKWRGRTPDRELDRLHLKLAHFYRADCLFDLGRYDEAIRHYDAAATRYQNDPSALTAFVQIVNAYCAMGKLDQARAANERAKYLLRRMPPETFKDGTFAMPREYWERQLKWTSEAGIW